jgi:hypothetical protein
MAKNKKNKLTQQSRNEREKGRIEEAREWALRNLGQDMLND